MARRNPLEETKKRYFKYLNIRKIHPWLFYHECIKCGDEFCREPMYECSEHSAYFSMINYYKGCCHCFNSEEEFRRYLEENKNILVEDDFKEFNEKLLF